MSTPPIKHHCGDLRWHLPHLWWIGNGPERRCGGFYDSARPEVSR